MTSVPARIPEPGSPIEPSSRLEPGPRLVGSLLLLGLDQTQAWKTKRKLEAVEGTRISVQLEPPAAGVCDEEYDLIVIDIRAAAGAALAWGLRLLTENPAVQIVFSCEDPAAPELAAVRALGLTEIVVGEGAGDWLVEAAPALFRLARARRDLQKAEAEVPPFPRALCPSGDAEPLPLPIAEIRFRESYVRAVLAVAGDRASAARRAGIPYRTLCRILQASGTTSK